MADTNDTVQEPHTVNVAKIEKRVMGAIRKMKKSRSRPCFQNVHTLVNRGGNDISMEQLKDVIKLLLEKKLICDKGKEGSESFFILENILSNEEASDEEASDEEASDDTRNENLIEAYINEKFYETLVNKIKGEVKMAVSIELNEKHILSHIAKSSNELNTGSNYVNNDGNSITNDALQTNVHSRKDTLIESLKEEINFLRNQVKSQNRIIELMTVKSNNAVETRNMNTSKKPMKKDEINNQIEILLNTGDVGSEQIRNEDNDRKEYGHDVNSNITETNVIETQ